jgi:hypothetical protein
MPGEPGPSLAEMTDLSAPQRRFLMLPSTLSGYDFNVDHKHLDNSNKTPLVHNEIEGTKMKNWCIATIAALAVASVVAPVAAAAAAAGCLFLGPLAFLCVLVVLVVIALIVWGVSEAGRASGEAGAFGDVAVDPDAVSINSSDHNIVAVEGRFIYDAGHEGWLELHAVRKIMTLDEDDHENLTEDRAKEIIEKIQEAKRVAETGEGFPKLTAYHNRVG